MRTNEIPALAAENFTILDAYTKCQSVLQKSEKAVCSVSGGADSDIMMDMICRMDRDKQVRFIFFNTGLEYQATLRHLDDLEQKYGRKIERYRAIKTVPQSVREYGQPFISKNASEQIFQLQKVGFKFEDKPVDILLDEYPTQTDAIKWWCNEKGKQMVKPHARSFFNIMRNSFLKEFMTDNPPEFKISALCCTWAKKKTAHEAQKGCDLSITGVRKAEGGIRRTAYQNCYSYNKSNKINSYRPLFWFDNKTKDIYNDLFQIENSDCYKIWGFSRTGCVGCPFSLSHGGWDELEKTKLYEPKLYRACWNVFGDSYRYMQAYQAFQKEQRAKKKREKELEKEKQTVMEGF